MGCYLLALILLCTLQPLQPRLHQSLRRSEQGGRRGGQEDKQRTYENSEKSQATQPQRVHHVIAPFDAVESRGWNLGSERRRGSHGDRPVIQLIAEAANLFGVST
ncbi:hypothetical protein FB45DRAFT_924859 [Roridomyces roridus]|uniref:Secreted protein n=1 Tax=Roridomyces roridus TaxID=1738132 RepID=A0AAD7BJU1_9AGAR|nr:hypothetical protein FB45DRAFT_924859 [Roridomyces roridus]